MTIEQRYLPKAIVVVIKRIDFTHLFIEVLLPDEIINASLIEFKSTQSNCIVLQIKLVFGILYLNRMVQTEKTFISNQFITFDDLHHIPVVIYF